MVRFEGPKRGWVRVCNGDVWDWLKCKKPNETKSVLKFVVGGAKPIRTG
jgi:hypothetical protein